MRNRRHPQDRRDDLLEAGIEVAKLGKLYTMTGYDVTEVARCGRTLLFQYFSTFDEFRGSVIRRAVRTNVYEILLQAKAKNDPLVSDMTEDQHQEVNRLYTEG